MRNDRCLPAATAASLLGLLPCAGAAAATAVFSSGENLGLSIPDADAEGVSSTIEVPDDATILRVAVAARVEHTFVGDLVWRLAGPDGTTITLADQPGTEKGVGDSADLQTERAVIFGDRSPFPAEKMGGFGCFASDSAVGIDCPRFFAPDEPLTTFLDGASAGLWTLHISDVTPGDVGFLDQWYVAFEFGPAPIPVPGAAWLFASALVAGAAVSARGGGRRRPA